MKLKKSGFLSEIIKNKFLGIDSNILIYHLEDIAPYSELTQALILLMARNEVVSIISTITVTELLAKPYSEGDVKKVEITRNFLQSLPGAEIVPPDFETAQRAAYLRGKHGFRTPDALLLATAQIKGAKAFVTNDRNLVKVKTEGIKTIIFDDYVTKTT